MEFPTKIGWVVPISHAPAGKKGALLLRGKRLR
jgi:hypothetical protein